MEPITVRPARANDAAGMAAVHVQSWQETYRGLVPDSVLDAPDFIRRRAQWWTKAVEDGAEGTRSIAVAELDGKIIGIAAAGDPRDDDATWPIELFVVYLLAAYHGTGTGVRLVDHVIGDRPASLWVADPNPRAQAFYRKIGFEHDGTRKNEGIPEIRMVRRLEPNRPAVTG